MTEEQLLIGRWITEYLGLNEAAHGDDITFQEERDAWLEKLPEACTEAVRQFGVSVDIAKELFEKSLDIRARNMNL